MAGGLMRPASIVAALMLSVVMASAAAAQALRDPTRPAATAGVRAAVGGIDYQGWALQSVLISPQRRYAIINGQVVQLGGLIAGAELVAVAHTQVTLRTREGLRVVHLFPQVSRLDAAHASADTAKRAPTEKITKTITNAQGASRPGIKK